MAEGFVVFIVLLLVLAFVFAWVFFKVSSIKNKKTIYFLKLSLRMIIISITTYWIFKFGWIIVENYINR